MHGQGTDRRCRREALKSRRSRVAVYLFATPPIFASTCIHFCFLARLGRGPMSDLSPLSGDERTLDFGAVRSVDDPGCVKTQKSKRDEE